MQAKLETITDAAYRAWELKEHGRAAELFLQAAEIESQLAQGRSKYAAPNQAFSNEIRAGFCFFEAGEVDKARPILERAIAFDWKTARLWGDRHSTETAITYLLVDLADLGKKKEFRNLFDLGIRRGNELKYPFPTIIPNQRKLIAACMALGERERCRIVVEHISDDYIKKDVELKLMKSQAEKFIAGGIFSLFRRK